MLGFKSFPAKLASCLAGAGLLALSGSLHPLWWAAWPASVPVLVAAFRSRARDAFGLAFLAALIGGLPMSLYLSNVAPPPIAGGVSVVLALIYATGILLASQARHRIHPALAVFAFPAWAAGFDTLLANTSPHGSALSLAYSQMDFVPAIQVAALGGTPAIVFLVDLFASSLAFLLDEWDRPRRGLSAAGPGFAVVAAGLLFGCARVAGAPTTPEITVALAALDQGRDYPDDWRGVLDSYRPRLADAVARGARLVVLPEEVARVSLDELTLLENDLGAWAKASKATLAIGLRVGKDGQASNRLLMFTPDGRSLAYDKRHLIPGLESGQVVPGEGPVLSTQVEDMRLGGAICKDFDFAETGRALAAGGARIVAAPAWDFGEDAWLHGRMAVLRGVEGGFTLVRSARRGDMTVSDRYGRVLASAPSGPEASILLVQTPLPNFQPPLYARIGDLFGWSCVAITVVLTLTAALTKFCPRQEAVGGAYSSLRGRQ